MLLVEVPWASRVWALPFLSVLGSFRALCCQAGQTAQEDNLVVGLAAAFGLKAMVSRAGDRGHSRSRLRLSEAAFSLPLESTRTRAESLGETSTTDSPEAANLTARCLPRGRRRSPPPIDARGTVSLKAFE
jgi:hypothetical protein